MLLALFALYMEHERTWVGECLCLGYLRRPSLLCAPTSRVMQNTLRVQATAGRSYDLVTAVARYFVTLEAHGDENGVAEMLQAVATMIDMMQGPCVENINTVINAKVVDACKRILAWTDRDLKASVGKELGCTG